MREEKRGLSFSLPLVNSLTSFKYHSETSRQRTFSIKNRTYEWVRHSHYAARKTPVKLRKERIVISARVTAEKFDNYLIETDTRRASTDITTTEGSAYIV